MRNIYYAIFNKETNERVSEVFTSLRKCEAELNKLGNDNYHIRHKWMSI